MTNERNHLIPILLMSSVYRLWFDKLTTNGKMAFRWPFALSQSKGANTTFSNKVGIGAIVSPVDGLLDEDDYEFQQRVLKTQLDSLVIPEERSALQAGHVLENLPLLWEKANLEERHCILNGFLECVYVDLQKPGTVVGIMPKPQFMGLFQFMDPKSESAVTAETTSPEPQNSPELDLTGWWRRGRGELHQPVKLAAALGGWKAIPTVRPE